MFCALGQATGTVGKWSNHLKRFLNIFYYSLKLELLIIRTEIKLSARLILWWMVHNAYNWNRHYENNLVIDYSLGVKLCHLFTILIGASSSVEDD